MKMRKSKRDDRVRRGAQSENPKVLVVDDDLEVTHLLAAALKECGYVVLQANSAAEAIRIAREETIDAALIDVPMSDLDGFGVLRRLKENDEHLVVVIMADYGDLEEARQAMRLDAYDYITKPFDIRVLRTVLRAGLKESSRMPTPHKRASSAALTTSGR